MIRPGSLQVPIRAVKNARVIRSSQIPASHGVDQAILAAAYTQVPRLGFTPSALVAGARDCGYLDAAPSILADGSFLLIRYHMVTKREEIAKRYKDEWQSHEHPDIKTVLGRVERLFWSRLTSNSHVIHHWPNALSLLMQPRFLQRASSELGLLVDDFVSLAGFRSVDVSWYSIRCCLAAAYSATELFMTTDNSPHFESTRQFLSRRMCEVRDSGELASGIRSWAGFTTRAARNVLTMN